MATSIGNYLSKGRLADVLALIQVLAYDRDTSRSEKGLHDEFRRTPCSATAWIDLASQHPEFFRVRNNEKHTQRVALLARHVLEYQQTPDGNDEKRPPLPSDIANKLMETAISMHDRQLTRSERWKTIAAILIPMFVAVIAASSAITSALISVSGKTEAQHQLAAPPTSTTSGTNR